MKKTLVMIVALVVSTLFVGAKKIGATLGLETYSSTVPENVTKFTKSAAEKQAADLIRTGKIKQLTLIYTNTEEVLVIELNETGKWVASFKRAFTDLKQSVDVYTFTDVPPTLFATR